MKINLGDIEETLLIPLWGRARTSREYPSLLDDKKAIELFEQIGHDFSPFDTTIRYGTDLVYAARAKQIDDKIRGYLAKRPKASVINLGAGLDTAFYRVDNGALRWYDLDVPSVMALRTELLPAPERTTYISDSLFDPAWHADITDVDNGVFMFASGVFMFYEESRIRALLSMLADRFPDTEIVFDTQSRLGKFVSDWGLSRIGMKGSKTRWALKNARAITRWDSRFVLLDQFPVFRGISREPAWGTSTTRWVNFVDRHRVRNIVHLRI